MADNKKRYYRDIKEGDVSLLAPGGNGVFMDGKNTYLFTENTTQDLEKLNQEQYNGSIPIDPNNVASAIIISKDGSYNTTLGNNNIDTLNLNEAPANQNNIITPTKKDPIQKGKGLIIGDSQTSLIQSNSKLLQPLNNNLHKVGWNVINLNTAILQVGVDDTITHLFICIGTNDLYQENKKVPITTLVKNIKSKFPKAKLYVIKGSIGWGGVANITEAQVNTYYKLFEQESVKVLVKGIGYSSTHPGTNTPGIKQVALEIDEKISEELPIQEPQPFVVKTTVETVEEETINTDLYTAEFESLPTEEGIPIYDVIQVKDNDQPDVTTNNSPSLVSEASLLNIEGVKNRNKGKVPPSGGDFDSYGSSFKLIQNEGKYDALYYYPCALFNQGDKQWGSFSDGSYTLKRAGCCYCSFSMIATHKKNNAGYTPEWFWDNVSKSVVVTWPTMAKSIGATGIIKDGTMDLIDKILKTGPLAFEWNVSKAKGTDYNRRYSRGTQHWMVINGKNNNGTYIIFDPAGGKIWPGEPREAIAAGLKRIFYLK